MIVTAQRKTRAPSRRALAVSIAIHALVGIGLVRVLLMPSPLRNWLHLGVTRPVPVEHIQYVAVPESPRRVVAPPRTTPPPPRPPTPPSGGAQAPLVAPPAVPTTIPAAPSTKPVPAEVNGVGPVARTGGPGQGAQVEYHGPEVWVAPAGPQEGRLTSAERTDSSLHALIAHHNDSLAMLGPTRKPGDWTFGSDKHKWGVDPKFIHLGPIEIPTAILAALPLNITGNPIASQNERLLTQRHDDIAFHANQAMNEEEFRKAVKEERLRKDRERKEQQKQQKPDQGKEHKEPPPPSPQPPPVTQ